MEWPKPIEQTPEPKRVYVSAKVNQAEDRVAQIVEAVTTAGHQVVLDWTQMEVRTPYLEHREFNTPAAIAMMEAARSANVLILEPHSGLYGALIELGAFLGTADLEHPKTVYVIGVEVKQSLFFCLPDVKIVSSLEEIIADLDN